MFGGTFSLAVLCENNDLGCNKFAPHFFCSFFMLSDVASTLQLRPALLAAILLFLIGTKQIFD